MGRTKIVLFKTSNELLEGYGLNPTKATADGIEIETRYVSLRGKKLQSGNISLYLNRQENGRQIKRYLDRSILCIETDSTVKARNKETVRQARVIADEANASAQKEITGFTITRKARVNLISYILFQADEALKKSGNPHGYYYTLQSLAKHIELFAGAQTTLLQVDKDFLTGFINYLKTANNFNHKRTGDEKKDKDVVISQNTQHNLFMKFKYVIRKALRAGVITINPLDALEDSEKPKAESGTREYLTIQEIKKLITTDFKHDNIKRAFLFCCLVGLRYSDVASITWNDIEKDSKGDSILRLKIKKTGREEIFPVSDEAMRMLPDKGDAADEDIIFSLPKNDHANKYIKKWVESAGIKKRITFHRARHTKSTLWLKISELQGCFFLIGNDLETSEPLRFAPFCIKTKNDSHLQSYIKLFCRRKL